MKIGVNTLIWTAGFDREHLPLMGEAKRHGFDGIEIARFDWAGVASGLAGEIRGEAETQGLDVTVCSAFTSPGCCLATEDRAARDAAGAFLREAIDATAAMGSRTLAGPFHGPVGHLVAAPERNGMECPRRWPAVGGRVRGGGGGVDRGGAAQSF